MVDLDEVDLSCSQFLEASAGTGKTFSIEHLYTRCLIEQGHPLSSILVVTFTRNAAQEVYARIQKRLLHLFHTTSSPSVAQRAYWSLIHLSKDNICTLHSFCAQLLRKRGETWDFTSSVRDFFDPFIEATESVTPAQLARCMGRHHQNLKTLLVDSASQKTCIQEGAQCRSNRTTPKVKEALIFACEALQLACADLASQGIKASDLVQDCVDRAPHYRGTTCRDGSVSPTLLDEWKKFAQHCEENVWGEEEQACLIQQGLSFCSSFSPSSRKKKGTDPLEGVVWQFRENLQRKVVPLVDQARDVASIVRVLAHDLRLYAYRRGVRLPDDAVEQCLQLVDLIHPPHEVVFVDECQDIDPSQWALFEKMYLMRGKVCFFVGDPKQSIYRFRQADLNLYFSAKGRVPSSLTLDTNYRTAPGLLRAINQCFSFCSPLYNVSSDPPSFHDYSQSLSASSREGKMVVLALDGQKSPIELERLSILALLNEWKGLDDVTILVRDRYQAHRIELLLRERGWGVCYERNEKQHQNPAFRFLRCVCLTLFQKKKWSKADLCFGWPEGTHAMLYTSLVEEGWGVMVGHLLAVSHSLCGQACTVGEQLERAGVAARFYALVDQVQEKLGAASPHVLPSILHVLEEQEVFVGIEASPSLQKEGRVRMMTVHKSKGLEFSHVFLASCIAPLPKENPLEDQAESLRTLYVGMTRACHNLYLPVRFEASHSRCLIDLYWSFALLQRSPSGRGPVESSRKTLLIEEWLNQMGEVAEIRRIRS